MSSACAEPSAVAGVNRAKRRGRAHEKSRTTKSGQPRGSGRLPPLAEGAEDLARGILARAAGDAPAGMGAGAAQVEPVEAEAVAGVAEQRPPQEELVETDLGMERVPARQPEL